MIGIVIVTHGRLAEEFLRALEHVMGPQAGVACVAIGPEDDMAARREDILAAVRAVDSGAGVIILTDMFGGTPSNLAISLITEATIEVVAGVNLPMLVKIADARRTTGLSDLAAMARDAGRHYIRVISATLANPA